MIFVLGVQAAAKHRRDYDELASDLTSMAEILREHLQDPKSIQGIGRLACVSE